MALTSVKMTGEVWLACMTHALSTETEEIMGLLLGDIQHSRNGDVTALIWGALPQPRSDRRKDRVETNPEQLVAASAYAERMTIATGVTTQVIGWYHSHPHITVLPSHVDVRTQAVYQLMDSGFIGLIFSCFNEDAQKAGRIQVLAFQSLDGKRNHELRLASVSPLPKSPVIEIESSSSFSKNALTRPGFVGRESIQKDNGDSRASAMPSKDGGTSPDLEVLIANADASTGDTYHANTSKYSIPDLDPVEDTSGSMLEALRLSNLEMSGAEYVRKEIPLHVLPPSSLLSLDSPLSSFTNLQRVLFEEERTAYNQAVIQNMSRNGEVHPLMFTHHTSTYQASLCKMMEYCLTPAINALQARVRENEIQIEMLAEEAKVLEKKIVKESESNSPSSSSWRLQDPRLKVYSRRKR
ncbi:lys-63-specific deubiquitinase BRCC36-like [Olea europaea subsp. europaea]|uniref:Lys-63-specific deubiquitinase BRCC36-like n=2 Tax=Olea europaea subsp. europaea TaxID=158383 RepID=A0A8S0RJW6_OLEEU|nr:lys-63-specific deubiquitinase BRCC36-like [Olea europaea subsp. europaea]